MRKRDENLCNLGMAVRREVSEGSGEKFVLRQSEEERNLPSVPCYRLTAIAAPLMNHLKAMMQTVQDLETENSTLKSQLYHYKVCLDMTSISSGTGGVRSSRPFCERRDAHSRDAGGERRVREADDQTNADLVNTSSLLTSSPSFRAVEPLLFASASVLVAQHRRPVFGFSFAAP